MPRDQALSNPCLIPPGSPCRPPHLSVSFLAGENYWSQAQEARVWRSPALSSSWRPMLCLQESEGKGLFVWLSIVTSPVLAPVLAWGSEQQPCSHTSCGTAKSLHMPPPLPPTVRGRETFLTFFLEKRGEMSEFGGHHVIQIAI